MSQRNPGDAAIIDLYFARDERAIKETDEKYGKVCMQVSMNIVNSRPDAEECVSDGYLKTWNSIPPARPHSLCAFICRIVRNLSINRLRDMRAEKRSRELTVSLEELGDCIPMPDESSAELAELLSAFLSELGETDRILFMGRYWYACSVADLAKRLGMTANAVSLRLHKTREKLRVYLTERGYRV
ncbi:MAG: sigma-70 family RNA polymerase sigma factor [Clostridia bacterium]|nr:sigma-70 family RNA polymerase sigma factor [Clostridia bacterium]